MVYFVESSARYAELIRSNLQSLPLETGFKILRKDSIHALRELNLSAVRADFVFLDPPYDMERSYREVLSFLATSELLKGESAVIAEHQKKFDPGEAFANLQRYRNLVQGDAALSFYRLSG